MTDNFEVLEQLYDQLAERTPYYDWLGFECETLESGRIVITAPYNESTTAPDVAPDSMHGGVLATLVDAAAMGAIIAAKGEPVPLVTTELDITFHDATQEDVIVEGEVVGGEGTLMTARVDIYPETEWESDEPSPTASGKATARLFN